MNEVKVTTNMEGGWECYWDSCSVHIFYDQKCKLCTRFI